MSSDASTPRPSPAGASLPPNLRIYAVGDIHGRADLLQALLLRIAQDTNANPVTMSLLVFLGDYIDRGPDSAKVLDLLLMTSRLMPTICLSGNHELYALRFLRDPASGRRWLSLGGRETLASYGIAPPPQPSLRTLQEASSSFALVLPEAHRRFLASLGLSFTLGDYTFVHAGLEAETALAEQTPHTLTMIREPFLRQPAGFGRVVVHGHTPVAAPEIHADRINIDTAAYATGLLTCLVLEDSTVRFL